MQATKVTVSQESLSTSLTKQRKTELRRERVIELIKSKPAGAQIQLSEFAAATDMRTGNVHGLLQRMRKQGLISIEKLSPHELTYSVLEAPKAQWKTIQPHAHEQHSSQVVELAMRYYWETQDDSLHNFVEWAKGQ